MPSLRDTLRSTSPEGFGPSMTVPAPPPINLPSKGSNFTANTSIRTPLPPFNAGPDTLRQFDEVDGVSPKRRIIPLPVQTGNGSGGTVINNTTVISPTSGGGSSTAVALTAKTVTYMSPLLAPGTFDTQSLVMAKSFQLISADANSACEMRLYGSALGQAIDIGRALDAPVPAEVFNDLITDLVVDTAPYDWSWQNRVGVNTDLPQTTSAFLTVFNISNSPAQIQIVFTFLPLES